MGTRRNILATEPVQLRVYSPIWGGNPDQFVEDISPGRNSARQAQKWLRSFNRGPFIGSFELYDDESALADFFYSRLGYDVRESAAGVRTWDGFIYEMELTVGGSTRRRSYETLFNAVADTYDSDARTGWFTNTASIARYGRQEHIEYFACPLAAAQVRAQSILARHAWPWPRPMGMDRKQVGQPRLRVRAVGYSFAANFQYALLDDGYATASDVVEAIVTGSCPWLTPVVIQGNTLQVAAFRETNTRAWDWLSEIAELGDDQYRPWLAWVDVGRAFRYEPMPTSPPRYYWHRGIISHTAGGAEVNPWLVRPGVIRDLSLARRSAEPGSIFPDIRDGWIDEVECGPAGVSIRSLGSENDVLERQQQYAISIGESDADLTD